MVEVSIGIKKRLSVISQFGHEYPLYISIFDFWKMNFTRSSLTNGHLRGNIESPGWSGDRDRNFPVEESPHSTEQNAG